MVLVSRRPRLVENTLSLLHSFEFSRGLFYYLRSVKKRKPRPQIICAMTWRYARKYSFIHAHNKSTDFPDSIFMKPTNSQQHYVEIRCKEFHRNRTVNVDGTDRNDQSKMCPSLQWFSRNIITLRFYKRFFVQMFTQASLENWEVRAEIYWRPQVKYKADWHKTHAWFTSPYTTAA